MIYFGQIGKSRSKVKHPTHDNARFRAQPSTSGSRGEGLPGSHIPSHVIARLPSPSPPSPNLPPNSRHDSPSPYTMTPRIPGTPDRAHNVQLNREDVTQSQPSRSTLADLGEEVQKLGDQIELLHQQRAKWHEHLLLDSEVRILVWRSILAKSFNRRPLQLGQLSAPRTKKRRSRLPRLTLERLNLLLCVLNSRRSSKRQPSEKLDIRRRSSSYDMHWQIGMRSLPRLGKQIRSWPLSVP